jgi:solute carrier family 25 (mitochondrial phosphate transporter), member 23/24/25/41
VDHADKELWRLFESIDRDHNGEIDKGELRIAFAKAGVIISAAKLDEFFTDVDKNRDGVISYDEWRYGSTVG